MNSFSHSGEFGDTASSFYQGSSSHRLLFSAWLDRRITIFLETLRSQLKKSYAASSQGHTGSSIVHYGALDSILNQAMYFGQSFGRIGADFRLALIPIFKDVAHDLALNALQGVDIKFA